MTTNKHIHLLFGILFILLGLLLIEAKAIDYTHAKDNRIALLIGNSDYRDSPLKNPANDAEDLAEILTELDFRVTLKQNATLREMKTAVRQFGDALQKGDVGLFYYAGHGMQVKGRNFLIPIGSTITSESDIELESLDVIRVLGKMDDAGNGFNIVILDACRNNPFLKSFRNISAGLAKLDAPTGTLIAYATARGSIAMDGDGRNGIYTKHILLNLKKPGLAIEKVFKNVRISVQRETNNRQIPWESSSLTGDFYFNRDNQQLPPSFHVTNRQKINIRHHGRNIRPEIIGLSGRYLAIGSISNGYRHLYNISTSKFEDNKIKYYRCVTTKNIWKEYSVRVPNGKNLQHTLELRHLGELSKVINIDRKQHGVITAYSFTDHGNILLGTSRGYVVLYNLTGSMIDLFLFSDAPILSMAIQKDTLVAAQDNGDILIFNNVESYNNNSTIISLVK